jgi:glucose-1-phosphate adenylyltransferase
VIRRGAAVRGAIIDAHVVIQAGDSIGYNRERDRARFHVTSNGIVVVSPDHVAPFFKVDRPKQAEVAL